MTSQTDTRRPVTRTYLALTSFGGVCLLVIFALLIYLLVALWPPDVATSDEGNTPPSASAAEETELAAPDAAPPLQAPDGEEASKEVKLFWGRAKFVFSPSDEQRLLILVVTAAALGSFVHVAISYATYVGNRRYKEEWTLWYAVRPPVGVSLAIVVFLLIRGGLFTPTAAAEEAINPFGLVAIGGLIGMFAIEAADKLKGIFDSFFGSPQPGGPSGSEQHRKRLDKVVWEDDVAASQPASGTDAQG